MTDPVPPLLSGSTALPTPPTTRVERAPLSSEEGAAPSPARPRWNARALTLAMVARGVTASELARRLSAAGMPCVAQNVYDWLRGRQPMGSSLIYLAEVLDIDPKSLFEIHRPVQELDRPPP